MLEPTGSQSVGHDLAAGLHNNKAVQPVPLSDSRRSVSPLAPAPSSPGLPSVSVDLPVLGAPQK